MNKGTIIRTILRVAASLQNAAVMVTASVVAFSEQYNVGWLILAWAIFTIACDFVVSAMTTYYNNDYTVEADTGTKLTREMKELADSEWEQAEEPEDAEVEEDDDSETV